MKAIRSVPQVLMFLCIGPAATAAPEIPPAAAAATKAGAKVWEFMSADIGPDWYREGDAQQRPDAVVVKNGKGSSIALPSPRPPAIGQGA